MRVVSLRPQVPSPHHATRRCPARGAALRRAAGAAGAAGAARACPVMYPAAGIARNATAAATCAQSTVRAPKSGGGREFPLSPTVTGNGWGSVGAARGWRLRGGAQPRAPLPPASSGSAREPVPFRAPAVGAREAPAAGRGGRGGADLGLEGVVFQNLHRQLGADVPRRDAVDAHAVLPAESSSGAARGRSMRGCGGRRALAHSHARFFVSMSMAALVAA